MEGVMEGEIQGELERQGRRRMEGVVSHTLFQNISI